MPRLIIDNDAGVDDAWAIFLLLKAEPKNDVLALTCVNGNTSIENVCNNNLRLLAQLNEPQIAVYKGAASALVDLEEESKFTSDIEFFHGRNGFGDVELPEIGPLPELQKENAVNAIYRLVKQHPGEVSLVCCGPLTNIALAIRMYSDFVENVKEVFIMGGNYTAMGNKTRCAEFNFHGDPEAAYIVLHEMEGKTTLLPWETCVSAGVPQSWRENLGKNCGPCVNFLNIIEGPIMNRQSRLGYKYLSADQLLAAIVQDPSIVEEIMSIHASVELAGRYTRGQIVIDHLDTNKHNTKIVKRINLQKYQDLIKSLVKSDRRNAVGQS